MPESKICIKKKVIRIYCLLIVPLAMEIIVFGRKIRWCFLGRYRGCRRHCVGTIWQKSRKGIADISYCKRRRSYFNLNSSDRWIETYGEGSFSYNKDGQTLQGDTAVMCIKAGHDRNLPLQLNNFEWNYRGLLAASSGSCRTTNIHARDGYIHVSDWWQPRPLRVFFGSKNKQTI